MAIFLHTAEGGAANTQVTIANSGGSSGDAWDAVSPGIYYRNDIDIQGSLSIGVDDPGVDAYNMRWGSPGTDNVSSVGFFFYLDQPTTGMDLDLHTARGGNDTFSAYSLRLQGSNRLRVRSQAGSASPWTSAEALAPGVIYWVSISVNSGTTDDGSGTIRVAYRPASSSSWTEDSGVVAGNFGTGTALSNYRFGKLSNADYRGIVRLDYMTVRTGSDSSGLLAPPNLGNIPPTVTVSGSYGVIGRASLTSTSTDSDGIASLLWTMTAWPSGVTKPVVIDATSQNATFLYGTAGVYTAQLEAVDGLGASTVRSVTLTLPDPSTPTAGPSVEAAPKRLVWDGASFR